MTRLGKFEEAITHYKKALEVDETFGPSRLGIAYNLMFLDRHQEARELQHAKHAQQPKNPNDGQTLRARNQNAQIGGQDRQQIHDPEEAPCIAKRRADAVETHRIFDGEGDREHPLLIWPPVIPLGAGVHSKGNRWWQPTEEQSDFSLYWKDGTIKS